jgi:hypothetical protein
VKDCESDMILKDSIGRELHKLDRSVNMQGSNLLKNINHSSGPFEIGGPGPGPSESVG